MQHNNRVSGDGRAGATAPTTTNAQFRYWQEIHERVNRDGVTHADGLIAHLHREQLLAEVERLRAALTRLGGAHE